MFISRSGSSSADTQTFVLARRDGATPPPPLPSLALIGQGTARMPGWDGVCVFALLISHHRRVHTQEVSVSESCLQQKLEKEPLTCHVEVAKTFSSPANSSGRDFSCAPKRAQTICFLWSSITGRQEAALGLRTQGAGSYILMRIRDDGSLVCLSAPLTCSRLVWIIVHLSITWLCHWTSRHLWLFALPTLLFLFLLSLFSSCLHCAPECNYPIYMQNDASDVFVTEPHKDAELGDKDGRERVEQRGGRMERGRGGGEPGGRWKQGKCRTGMWEWMKKADGKWQLSKRLEDKYQRELMAEWRRSKSK